MFFCLLSSFDWMKFYFFINQLCRLANETYVAQHDLGVSTYEVLIYYSWLDENQTCRNGLEFYDLVIDYRVCSSVAIV